jgi:transcriptional regulator with XRE-family HTH domain
MRALGLRLAAARAHQGWNQSECARAAQVSRATLARLEAGQKPFIRSDMLFTMARTLNCSADFLLGLAEPTA